MKLYLLALLVLLPLLSPAFATNDIVITLDKTNYYEGESPMVSGSTDNNYAQSIDVQLLGLDPLIHYGVGGSYTDSDGNFKFTVGSDFNLSEGNYEVKITIGSNTVSAYFTIYDEVSILEIHTDKKEYYNSQDIFITGTTNQTGTINVTFSYINGTAMPVNYFTDIINGSFDGMIYTNDNSWDNYDGYVIINATDNKFWNTATFYYTNNEDMTNESLYKEITDQKLEINNLTTELDALEVIVEKLTNKPDNTESDFTNILNDKDTQLLIKELERIASSIDNANLIINQTSTYLDDAKTNNNQVLIQRHSENMESKLVLVEIWESVEDHITQLLQDYS